MLPTLITGSSARDRRDRAYKLAAKVLDCPLEKVDTQPDFFLFVPDPSITITQIRTLIANLSRKPLQSPSSVALLLEAQLATVDAQNALLKTLEEPFSASRLILTSPNKDLLLSTVVSRCQEISLKLPSSLPKTPPQTEITDLLNFFLSHPPQERLAKLDLIVLSKQESLQKLETLITEGEKKMTSTRDLPIQQQTAAFIRSANRARKYISANANLRLTLAQFLLSF